jgi:hypothetical protein
MRFDALSAAISAVARVLIGIDGEAFLRLHLEALYRI